MVNNSVYGSVHVQCHYFRLLLDLFLQDLCSVRKKTTATMKPKLLGWSGGLYKVKRLSTDTALCVNFI
jgi:hypothetical protein